MVCDRTDRNCWVFETKEQFKVWPLVVEDELLGGLIMGRVYAVVIAPAACCEMGNVVTVNKLTKPKRIV